MLKRLILVAPYWNLNEYESGSYKLNCLILVAPYWNLNNDTVKKEELYWFILVAPYWNLNGISSRAYSDEDLNISSSILEFK